VPLGDLPTPVEPLADVARASGLARDDLWVKRDDRTSPVYGGNKVRTLEVLFGDAKARGATHVYSTGAFGSNHATATVLHAPRAGLRPGVVLFPQPESATALENLRVIVGEKPEIRALWTIAGLPFGMWAARRAHARRGERAYVMVPGGATPLGALGYVSAAFELAGQIERGEMPAPARIVVGVGSTCTSAGLLLGFHHAARARAGFRAGPPLLESVRVTPWPVTATFRIVGLAVRASRLLASLAGDSSLAVTASALRPHLHVDGRLLGRGYGRPTDAGLEAITLFRSHEGLELDTTYSAKAAAGLLEYARRGDSGPILFWSTKSTTPLPRFTDADLAHAPGVMRRWMERAATFSRAAR
jgi:D-cysteine desulfhydrase